MLKLTSSDIKKTVFETLVIPVCENKNIYEDLTLSSLTKKAMLHKEFKGTKDNEIILYNLTEIAAERVMFLGLGKTEKIDHELLRSTAGKAVRTCIEMDLTELVIAVPSADALHMDVTTMIEAMLEGACLSNHIFDMYKQDKKHSVLENIHLLVTPDAALKHKSWPPKIETICQGTILARNWVSMPANDKRPEAFARLIENEARKAKLKIELFDEKDLQKGGFGALLAVASGSDSKPRLMVLEYEPRSATKTIVLVGKGVTFDSGGINIKPTDGLDGMKTDMSGAAAVAATLISAARLKSGIKIIGVLPLVENMPSGSATRPGDIVKTYAGKTVEIGNTDAEGRLILIDAISYAIEKYKPDTLIDLATLTGACVVALGEKIAGIFTFDDSLAAEIFASSQKTFERCWRMPLPEDYKELLKSDFADINNMPGTRYGGAITAALFLSEFIGNTRWAHIDIAGPAYSKKAGPYCAAGGTGFGVRLLCDLLDKL